MILLTLLITTLIARKKAKAKSNKILAVSSASTSSSDCKTKTPLDQYVEWLQNTDTTSLRTHLAKN